MGNAVIDNGTWWVCACGQLNSGRDECCECGASKGLLLGYEGEEGLIASASAWEESVYQKALSLSSNDRDKSSQSAAADLFRQIPGFNDADERLKACNDNIAAIETRFKRRITGAIIAAVAAVFIVAFVIVPTVKYNNALAELNASHYGYAVTGFQEIGSFLDSQERLKEAEYGYARTHLQRDDETTYQYLSDLKESGYKDSAELYSKLFDWRFEYAFSTDPYYDKNKKTFS